MQREELPDQVWVILSLGLGMFLLGDGLFWNEALRPASTFHRVILEAIGAVLIAFAIYLFLRMLRRRTGP
jgi:threonine/homoserine/homoserine lactone efflux protein